MSKHSYVSSDVKNIIRLPKSEIEQEYGVKILEDGSVIDTIFSRSFLTISDWATFLVEQEELEYTEQFHYKEGHDGDFT